MPGAHVSAHRPPEPKANGGSVGRRVLPSSGFFDQSAVDELVQDAGEKRLVWKTLLQSSLLQPDKVTLGHSDIHAFVFPQSCARRLTVASSLLLEIRNTLP